MGRKRQEKPFDKIMMTKGKLGLYVKHGDIALDGQTPQEFAADVEECFQCLMGFRNAVAVMADLEQTPEDAIKSHMGLD